MGRTEISDPLHSAAGQVPIKKITLPEERSYFALNRPSFLDYNAQLGELEQSWSFCSSFRNATNELSSCKNTRGTLKAEAHIILYK